MSDWQLEKTAPFAVDVLVFCPDAVTPIMICHRFAPDDWDWYEQNADKRPSPLDVEVTHWKPLPDGPTS